MYSKKFCIVQVVDVSWLMTFFSKALRKRPCIVWHTFCTFPPTAFQQKLEKLVKILSKIHSRVFDSPVLGWLLSTLFYVVHRSLTCASASQRVLVRLNAKTSIFILNPESESTHHRQLRLAHARSRRFRHTVNEIYDVLREKIRILSVRSLDSDFPFSNNGTRGRTDGRFVEEMYDEIFFLFSSQKSRRSGYSRLCCCLPCVVTLTSSRESVSKVIFIVPDNTTNANERRKT